MTGGTLSPKGLIQSKRCFIIDLDGVIYAGDHALPGAIEAVSRIQKVGRRVCFLTNNSVRAPVKIIEKLRRLGISCEDPDLISALQGAIHLIRDKKLDSDQGVYVVGSEDLKQALTDTGTRIVGPNDCGAVLAGMKFDFSYDDIADGLTALLRKVPFIACNLDANFPGKDHQLFPGCGAIVGALQGASKRKPDWVVGKPEPFLLSMLIKRFGLHADECLIIGDSLESDILMANKAGVSSVWISEDSKQLEGPPSPQPDFQLSSLSEAADLLE